MQLSPLKTFTNSNDFAEVYDDTRHVASPATLVAETLCVASESSLPSEASKARGGWRQPEYTSAIPSPNHRQSVSIDCERAGTKQTAPLRSKSK
jgi:hypothetical protein